MNKVVEKVFIGTDQAGDATILMGASQDIAAGEIVVADKAGNILTPGTTIADTDTIFIVECLSDTYDYIDPQGTGVTSVRRLLWSDPIKGEDVSEYSKKAYAAATEEIWSIDFSGWTPVIGTEYMIRIIYKDINGDPGQRASKSYPYIAGTATRDTEGAAIAALINADPERRITAAYATATDILTLTAKAYDDNDELTSVNKYGQVLFDVVLYSDNFSTLTADPYSYMSTNPNPGSGHYRLVRDEEKWSRGYEGIAQQTAFPPQVPTLRTVKSETYDCLLIRHKNSYVAADAENRKVDITTKIYIPNTATSNQMSTILSVLNPWMASTPGAFPNISF